MDRHDKEGSDFGKDNYVTGTSYQKYRELDVDHPKLSPMRRKDKARNGGSQPKCKRNHKKIQYRLKYNWEGE
jgi:hypothetical protein